jgi:putative membrane protein
MISQATFNASLNAASAVFLLAGYVCIRRGNVPAHRLAMLTATGTSIVFLVSYVDYHLRVGSVHFQGTGWIRPAYFSLLLSHTSLAVVNVGFVAVTLTYALREKFAKHRRIAPYTWWLWMYVSVTGVLVYFMLYHWFAPR